MLKHLAKVLLLVAAALSLAQCGEEGIGSKIDFEIIPKSPIIILADFTLDPGGANEKTVGAPWFAMNFSVTNNSDKDITIQAFRLKVRSMARTGGINTQDIATDAGDYPNETYLETVAPGATVTPLYTTYFSDLAEDVVSYNYNVELNIEGWVGTPILPEERLRKSVFFVTQ